MADDESSLRDEDGDFSDWIEIYNASTTLQNLEGWSLTDDVSAPAKWRFPAGIQIPAQSYLIVFASGKNRTNATRLHTNFGLSARGEYLGLIDPLGGAASEFAPSYPSQRTDISFGRDAADFSLLLFFPIATPGSRNVSGGAGFAPEVHYSRPSGTFSATEDFMLALETSSSNATIYYTFGTNLPTTAGLRYTNALRITNSTIVRARAFETGLLPGAISSRTYLALAPDVLDFSSDLPVMILHNFGQGAVLATGEEQYVALQSFEPRLSTAVQGRRSSMTNPPTQAERGNFHVRGFLTAVTSTQGKSSFLLEIQDELGADKDLPLLGLPEESDWVLYAPNVWDRALFQNPLAHQLLRDFGRYSSRTRFFELFLKDDPGGPGPLTRADYYGLFVLEERIKRDANRVDIEPLQPEHTHAPEITGGYIFSIDETNDAPQLVAGGAVMNWEYPSGFEMTNVLRAPQLNYIRDYFNAFNSALHSPTWTDPVLGYAPFIDIGSWIDYHLHCVLTFSPDALRLSTYFYKPREQPLKFGPGWDFDRSQGSADSRDFNPVVWRSLAGSDYFNEAPWWFKLFSDPDFWQKWIDRYQQLRDGPLALNQIFLLIDEYSQQVREAQRREQARWNILPRAGQTNVGGFFYDFGSIPSYDNEIRFKKYWYSLRLNFMDSQFLGRPTLTSTGGLVEAGSALAVLPAAKPGTSVLCTLDGSDPRLPGGRISPYALSNLGPLVLNLTTNVRVVARSYNPSHRNLTGPNNPPLSSPWSGPMTATFYTELPALRITELMYHPESPAAGTEYSDEDFEFVEVKNIGSAPLNVKGFKLSGGIEFDFPQAVLQPGELAAIVADVRAFETRYPWRPRVLGIFSNRLDNAGERLVLAGPLGEPILDFVYDDDWYPVTDGLGFALVVVDATAPPETWNSKSQWRPSVLPGAFPAADDPTPSRFPHVVINEVSATLPPDVIELRNLSAEPANIGGWFLTDDFRAPKKYSIPMGTVLEPGGFILFDETTLGFGLSPSGEEVYLFSGDEGTLTGYSHGFDFGAIESGLTFGRFVNRTGAEQFPPQASPSLGTDNVGPRIGPVVITEIHYHPPDYVFGTNVFDNSEDEYLELFNLSEEALPLSGARGWELTDAVHFAFPAGQFIPARGLALLVGFDASDTGLVQAFRSRHDIPSSVAIYGPFEGKLDNSNDRVELQRRLPPELAGAGSSAPFSLAERIHYSDDAPWPSGADGLGRSLQRLEPAAYGNDPANWAAAEPSPGRLWVGAAGPRITMHPQDATVVADTAVAFSVSAEGEGPLTFQWRFKGRMIPLGTNASLILTNVQPAAAGAYDVVVMNHANSASSSPALLAVLAPVQIARQPQNQTVDDGATVYFSVIAVGQPPVRYQWRLNGVSLAGETRPVLSLPTVSDMHQGLYDVAVSNSVGWLLSSSAMLAVRLKPTVRDPISPLQISAAPGETITLGADLHGTFPLWVSWWRFGPGAPQMVSTQVLPSPGPLPLMVTQAASYITFHVQTNSSGAFAVLATNAASAAPIAFTNAFLTVLNDSDLDLIPDNYETEMGMRVNDASDAAEDLDHDGVSNRDEYIAGTDARDPNSSLRLSLSLSLPVGESERAQTDLSVRLGFGAISNRTYSVQYTGRLPATNWVRLKDVVARATNHLETLIDPDPGAHRYYRLATPAGSLGGP